MALSQICSKFILNQINIGKLERNLNGQINSSINLMCETIINEMRNTKIEEIIEFIKNNETNEVNSANIPQFSFFDNGTIFLIEKLRMGGNYGPTFKELGEQFLGQGKKKGAYVKYGENHAKLGRLYDLVYIKKDRVSRVYLSTLGRILEGLEIEEQEELLSKFSFKIPIIQQCIKYDILNSDGVMELLMEYLSVNTALRRKSNVINILKMLG